MSRNLFQNSALNAKLAAAIENTPKRADRTKAIRELLPKQIQQSVCEILPDLEIFTYFTVPNERRHSLNAIIAKQGRSSTEKNNTSKIREMFFSGAQAELISEAYGSVPHGLVGYLRCQDSLCLRLTSYEVLHRLFLRMQALGASCSPLVHLDEDRITELADLPEACLQSRLVRDLAQCRNPKKLGLLLRALESSDDGRRAVFRATHAASSFPELIGLLRAEYEKLPFPKPPVSGAALVPLSDAAALKTTARRLRNCLASRIPEVHRGEEYYFLWRRDGIELVCQIVPDQPFGWRIGNILAEGNDQPDPADHAAAIRDLEIAGAQRRPSVESLLDAISRQMRRDDEDDLLNLDLFED